ncbi:MAG TPA: hypothetical protein VMY18_14220 [Acidobacteriota bacterium]|nr:hypothetical protein [Acidobacteriota bacterium]
MNASKCLLLLATSLLLICAASVRQVDDVRASNVFQPVPRFEGSLDIRLHPGGDTLDPPAQLLLKSPDGKRTGFEPVTGNGFSEIPHSSLESEGIDDDVTGAPGPRSLVLFVGNPEEGAFRLQVIATRSGTYTLEVQGYDVGRQPSNKAFTNREISEGETHLYLIQFSTQAGEGITVTYAASSEVQR